jgi:hypothetical protein
MIRILAPVVLWLACSRQSPPGDLFNLARDFSGGKNPSGPWRYGYSAGQSLDPSDFRMDRATGQAGAIAFWHPTTSQGGGPGYYPYVAHNPSNKTELYGSSHHWSLWPGQVAMEGSNSGQYSIVRFTVPASGIYRVSARFQGVHFDLSTTDVHVMHNERSLFAADIDGYGGDRSVHPIVGANPAASFSESVTADANDTIDFAVGYGKNENHYSDTTGLFAEIKLVSRTQQ